MDPNNRRANVRTTEQQGHVVWNVQHFSQNTSQTMCLNDHYIMDVELWIKIKYEIPLNYNYGNDYG